MKMQNLTVLLSLSLTALLSGSVMAGPVAAPEAFEYLKGLEGKWVVQNGKPDAPQWEFEVTSRGSAIVERLLIGTEKEMTTVYHLDNDRLIGTHYCQMKNQPHIVAVSKEGDNLNFECDGNVTNTKSHQEQHMHNVRYKRMGEDVEVSMDIVKEGQIVSAPAFRLTRLKE